MKDSLPLRALSRLLQYHDFELRENLLEMKQIVMVLPKISKPVRIGLNELIQYLHTTDLYVLQEEYVEYFDRGRATSLHLFEHVHGDSRERGQAMVDLLQTYKAGGLILATNELPDQLSIVLEFASTLELAQSRQFIAEMAHILNAIYSALVARQSRYAWVVAAAIEYSGEKVKILNLKFKEESIDEAWAEPPAFGGCTTQGQGKPDDEQPLHFIRLAKDKQGVQA